MGERQMVGVSLTGDAVKPTPVRVLPETVRAVISWMPWPLRPVTEGELGVQVRPSVEVQMTTFWRPAEPNVPTAVKPPPVAATACTAAVPSGDGWRESGQGAPPSLHTRATG